MRPRRGVSLHDVNLSLATQSVSKSTICHMYSFYLANFLF